MALVKCSATAASRLCRNLMKATFVGTGINETLKMTSLIGYSNIIGGNRVEKREFKKNEISL